MAFNLKTFKTRALTAIVFAIVMLGGLLWNQWSFFVLFSIIHFGCWWEYLNLTEKIQNTTFHIYTKLGLMLMGYGLLLWFCGPAFHINNYGLKESLSLPVSAAGFALLLIGIFQKNAVRLKAFGMAVFGLLYISVTIGLMISIYGFADELRYIYQGVFDDVSFYRSWFFPVVIIASIWINDTMAYIVGSLIGKRPLSKISPRKTWEGTIGGIILSGGVGFLIPFIFNIRQLDPLTGMIIALSAAVTGTFGDLFESKLKRMAGVKDSGTMMPGHGGFMDRFDSLLFAIPFSWVLLNPNFVVQY